MSNMIEILKRDFGLYKDFKAIFANKKERNKFLLTLFLIPLGIVYVIMFMIYMLSSYDQFVQMGMQNQFLMTGFSIYLMIMVFFITPFIVSKIYFSNHTRILLRYPITDKELLGSRLINLIIYSLMYSVAVTIPIIIKYGIEQSKSILFYLKALILIVGISAITVSVLSIIVIFIMKFINKNASLKKVLTYVFTLLVFLLIVAVQFVIQSQTMEASAGEFAQTAGRTASILTNFVPQLKLTELALTVNNEIASWGFVALMSLIAIILVYITINFFSRMMIAGVLSANTIQRKKIKTKDYKKTAFSEIYGKELKNIFSNAMYFLNKVLFGILVPVFILIPLYLGMSQAGVDIKTILGEYDTLYNNVLGTFENPTLAIAAASTAVALLQTIFVASGSEIASTTFTREGKNLWMMKAFPIKTRDQLLSRIMASADIIVLSSFPMLILFAFLFRFNVVAMILMIITSVISSISISCITLTIGILNVKPNWDNAQQAIKGLVGIVSLLVCLVVGFLLFFPPIKMWNQIGDFIFYVPFIQVLIVAILGIAFYFINTKLYEKKLRSFGN